MDQAVIHFNRHKAKYMGDLMIWMEILVWKRV